MPEVYCIQSFGVALIKGLDPFHLQSGNGGYDQQSPAATSENVGRSIVFRFGLYTVKA